MRYRVEIRNKIPTLISDDVVWQIVRWFPSPDGITVSGINTTSLLTAENCDLEAVKQSLAGLVTSPMANS